MSWVDWVCSSDMRKGVSLVSREDLTMSIIVDNHVINTDISPAKGNLFKTLDIEGCLHRDRSYLNGSCYVSMAVRISGSTDAPGLIPVWERG